MNTRRWRNLRRNEQPSAQQVAELQASIDTYDKWDQVLEAFRRDAFSD